MPSGFSLVFVFGEPGGCPAESPTKISTRSASLLSRHGSCSPAFIPSGTASSQSWLSTVAAFSGVRVSVNSFRLLVNGNVLTTLPPGKSSAGTWSRYNTKANRMSSFAPDALTASAILRTAAMTWGTYSVVDSVLSTTNTRSRPRQPVRMASTSVGVIRGAAGAAPAAAPLNSPMNSRRTISLVLPPFSTTLLSAIGQGIGLRPPDGFETAIGVAVVRPVLTSASRSAAWA